MKKPFLTSSAEFTGDVSIGGNLTVTGTTTSIDTTNLQIEDKNIVLAKSSSPTNAAADGGGITLQASTDKTIIWDSTNDSWGLNCNLEVSGNASVGASATSTSAGYIKVQGYRNAADQGVLGHIRFDNQNEDNTAGKIEVYAGGSTTTGTMRFHTSGSEKMRIAANGNVGIGTTNPGAKLQVVQTSGGTQFEVKGTAATGGQFQVNNAGGDIYSNFRAAGSNDDVVKIHTNGNSFFNGGNVGIGTTNPGNFSGLGFTGPVLEVDSLINIKSSVDGVAGLHLGGDTFRKASIYTPIGEDDPYLAFSAGFSGTSSGTTEAMRINSDGNVGIGTTNPGVKLQVHGDVLAVGSGIRVSNGGSASGVGIYSPAPNEMGISANSNEAIRIDSDGKVGIGTTNPGFALDVNGDGFYDSSLRLTRNDGLNEASAGQYNAPFVLMGRPAGTGSATQSIKDWQIGGYWFNNDSAGQPGVGIIRCMLDNDVGDKGRLEFVTGTAVGNTVNPQLTIHEDKVKVNQDFEVQQTSNEPSINIIGDPGNTVDRATIGFNFGQTSPNSFTGFIVGSNYYSQAEDFYIHSAYAGTTRLFINSSGNVGIGTVSLQSLSQWGSGSSRSLQIKSAGFALLNLNGDYGGINGNYTIGAGNGRLYLAYNQNTSQHAIEVESDGQVVMGGVTPHSVATYRLYVVGSINATGDVYNSGVALTSDDRLKHNEQTIVGALDTLAKITPKKYIKTTEMYDADHDFELDDDGNPIDEDGELVEHRIEAGIIAQEVLTVDELAFSVTPEGVDENGDVTSPHYLNYNNLLTYAIAAINELKQEIDQLKNNQS